MRKGIIISKIVIASMLAVILGLLVWFGASFSANINAYIGGIKKEDKIHFINVISSDSILVESNGEYGLIDASYSKDDPTSHNINSNGTVVLNYLKKMGVNHLKFVIATHPHKDHVGGIPEIVNNSNLVNENTTFIYKDVVMIPTEDEEYYKHQVGYYKTSNSGNFEEENAFRNAKQAMISKKAVMLDTLSINKAALRKLNAKISDDSNVWNKYLTFQMGDYNIKIYNLNLYTEMFRNETFVEINSNSYVILITSKDGTNILLMGDSTVRNKNEIYYGELIGKVDIYKASHHGCIDANSKNLIETIRPSYTVVTNTSESALSKGFGAPYTYINNYGGKVFFTGNSEVIFNLTNKLFVEKGKSYTDSVKEGFYEWYQNVDNKNIKNTYYIRDNIFLSGLQKIGNNYYIFDNDGKRLLGWQIVNNELYYFEPYSESNIGSMYINTKKYINGHKYKFNKKGVCESSNCKTILNNLKKTN